MRFGKLLLLVVVLGIGCLQMQCAESKAGTNVKDACARGERSWTPIERDIWMQLCRNGNASGARVSRKIRDSSSAHQPIRAEFLQKILIASPYRERVEKGISLTDMRLLGMLSINSTKLKGDIALSSFDAPDGIWFQSVVLDGSLSLDVCFRFFIMASSRVQGDLKMSVPDTCQSESILMPKTEVGGVLELVRSTFWFADLSGLRTGRGLSLHGSTGAVVSLTDAYVDGPVDLTDLVLSNEIKGADLSSIRPRRVLENRERVLSLDGLRATSTVDLSGAETDGPVGVSDARIEGSLIFTGASFPSLVDVSNSNIGKRLEVGPVVIGEFSAEPIRWGPKSLLTLDNTSISTIATPFDLDSWPAKMDLSNLTFTSFFERRVANTRGLISKPPPLTILALNAWFPLWLCRSVADPFNPQPYETVGHYLTSIGQLEAAEAVGVAEKDHQLAQAWKDNNYGTCIFLLFSRATVLYGYQLWRAALWAIFFVALGALVFRRTLEAYNNCMPIGLAYSFDMFIPLIKLRERHYKIELSGRARYYFYLHKLAGWVLGSFLVAAVSGLTK